MSAWYHPRKNPSMPSVLSVSAAVSSCWALLSLSSGSLIPGELDSSATLSKMLGSLQQGASLLLCSSQQCDVDQIFETA